MTFEFHEIEKLYSGLRNCEAQAVTTVPARLVEFLAYRHIQSTKDLETLGRELGCLPSLPEIRSAIRKLQVDVKRLAAEKRLADACSEVGAAQVALRALTESTFGGPCVAPAG